MKNMSLDPDSARMYLSWLNTVLSTKQAQIEKLGNGLAYCLIMHHFFPKLLQIKRINLTPRRLIDSIANLRLLAEVFGVLKWSHIVFDINKVANNSYLENLQLLGKIYAMLAKNHEGKTASESTSRSFAFQNNQNLTKFQPNKYLHFSQNMGSQSPSQIFSLPLSFPLNPKNNLNMSQSLTPQHIPLKQTKSAIQTIKQIIGNKEEADRQKIRRLKNLLQIETEEMEGYEEKDLLNDGKEKDIIVIEDH